MEEKNISGHESLLIIQQMINTAKKEQKDDGRGWIAWGWVLFVASIFTYINMKVGWLPVFYIWNIVGIGTLVVMVYELVRDLLLGKKKDRVRTYTKDLMEKLNVGFFMQLFFIILSINLDVPPTKGFALLIAVYGFWMLIYGAALNFKPSIIGAFVTWGFGLAAMFAKSFDWTMLLHAAAVLFGYIIPGHIARKEFKKVSAVNG